MDILIRLRVVLWMLVLSLWGLMIYQFLGEEEDVSKMQWVSYQVAEDADEDLLDIEDQVRIPASELFPSRPDDLLTEPSGIIMAGGTNARLARIPASLADSNLPASAKYRIPPPTASFPRPRILPNLPKPKPARSYPADRMPPVKPGVVKIKEILPRKTAKPKPPKREPARKKPKKKQKTPKGFMRTQTRHFTIFSQGKKPSLEFLETLESLHANLMLDLAAFSAWARDERVTIYLFRNQESYRKVTGRPAWSGGASSVKRRKIYLYETDELVGILAHELCHIYFDSFFLAGGSNPLWLSEGMATLVQTERGLAAPNWLGSNLTILRRGGGYKVKDLVRVETTTNASDDDVRLWYTQSYSVVRFLIRSQYRSSFFKFCRNLRDGMPPQAALYRAYGMPFNRFKALEFAWRYDLKRGKT
ncbi:peptidase MA family metallohydrolase [Elusimicrobiota bacterium]